jgi:hypothetical protein
MHADESESKGWHDPHSTLGYVFKVAEGRELGIQNTFEVQFGALCLICWLVSTVCLLISE